MRHLHIQWLLLLWIILSAGIVIAQPAAGFDPVISTLGFIQSGENGDYLEWSITVSNVGDEAGSNVIINDTLPESVRIDDVRVNTGTTRIDGQTVTVLIPTLAPAESVQFTIVTTPSQGYAAAAVSNTACVTAKNIDHEECASSLPIHALPQTGELPYRREQLMMLGLLALSVSVLMFGIAGAGLRMVTH